MVCWARMVRMSFRLRRADGVGRGRKGWMRCGLELNGMILLHARRGLRVRDGLK